MSKDDFGFTNEEQEVSLLGCRSYSQYYEMRKSFEAEAHQCVFCHPNPKINIPLFDAGTWQVWKNPFPHDHTEQHIVGSTKRHVRFMKDLTPNEWVDFQHLIQSLGDAYYMVNSGPTGGGIAIREGSLTHNAGTVPHLHMNFIIPDLTGNVKITLAKDAKKLAAKQKEVGGYAERYEAGETPN